MNLGYHFHQRRLFWIVFAIPNILSLLYFALIASPQYVSEASIVVYQSDQGSAGKTLQLTQSGGGLSLQGAYLLDTYLASWDAFARFDRKALDEGWSAGDFVSRFGGLLDAFRRSPTVLYRHYKSNVAATVDEESAIVTLRVTGYDPRFVKKVADDALRAGSRAINVINQQAFENAAAFFEQQIAKDQAKLRRNVDRLSAFQKASRIVDPAAAYGAKLDLLNQLNGKLAQLDAQADMVRQSTPGSDQVENLATQRRSLEGRIRALQGEVYGNSAALTQMTGTYTYLQTLIRNDEAALAADSQQLLQAHQLALQNQYYLGYVSYPNVPVNPTEPRRLLWILSILAGTFVLYVIIK